jgi:Family of unknown function (DUF5681)
MAKRGPKGRFVHGQSGNPGGRPKAEVCLTALLRAALAERDVDGKRTKARAVIDALITVACEGKTQAIEAIFDRIDGLLQPVKTEALDIGALIEEVAKRADDRKRSREPGEPVP